MPDRFFSARPLDLGEAQLDGPEAHHLLHVLRAKPGSAVVLFDGSGAEFDATVERTNRATVYLRVTTRSEIDREPSLRVTLGVAMPKGDRQRWLVEKATELGVARLVPLTTVRGVAQPGGATERFRRAVIEAAKQCGRNQLMGIAEARSLSEFCNSAPKAAVRCVAHPSGTPVGEVIDAAISATATIGPGLGSQTSSEVLLGREVWLGIGPEGGFTDAEVRDAAAAGWQTVSLGKRLLRTETAAIALAARFLVQ